MSEKEAGERAPGLDTPIKADQEFEEERRNSLVSLVFGSSGFGWSSEIRVDSFEGEELDDHLRRARCTPFYTVSMLLDAIDFHQELEGLFHLKKVDRDLTFALRHALIFFLQRLNQPDASAVGLMVETLIHFMQEHPTLKGYVRRWDEKFADTASPVDNS